MIVIRIKDSLELGFGSILTLTMIVGLMAKLGRLLLGSIFLGVFIRTGLKSCDLLRIVETGLCVFLMLLNL